MPSIGVSDREAADLVAYIEARQERLRRQIPLQPLLALTTADGKRLTAEEVQGRPLAVAFGFTHCPDVCPTTLLDWSNALASLGPDGDRIKVLFISVDPERDTPAALKSYMASFDPRITALTGSPGEVAAVAAAFGAHHAKVVEQGRQLHLRSYPQDLYPRSRPALGWGIGSSDRYRQAPRPAARADRARVRR